MKRIIILLIGFMLISATLFAGSGDLIVNGNLGVGTTSPAGKLDVQNNWGSEITPMANFQNTGDGYVLSVKNIGTTGDKTIANFQNNSGSVMIIRGNGNVGIGTTSPGAKLDVKGVLNANTLVSGDGNSILIGTSGANSRLYRTSGSCNSGTVQIADEGGYKLCWDGDANMAW